MKQEIKITTKLLISIIFITLLTMLVFECAYSKLVYEDYNEVLTKVQFMETRVKLLENYIYKGGNRYGS